MSAGAKAAIVTAVVAVLVAIGVVAASTTGYLPRPDLVESPDRVLVILASPDEAGTDVGAVAYVSDATGGAVSVLDPLAQQAVPGTSARTAREAFAFGGGDTTSRALSTQTGQEQMEWVVIRSAQWAELVDAAGGVKSTLQDPLNAYVGGRLVSVPAGTSELSGTAAVALAGGLPFITEPATRQAVSQSIAEAVDAAVRAAGGLQVLVAEQRASSSLDQSELDRFASDQ